MYAIIYLAGDPDRDEGNTILQILNSQINGDNWNPGETGLQYQNCTDNEDLITKANAIDAGWEAQFDLIYVKK